MSINRRINKLWKIHIMGNYSTIKRNELMIHMTTWMNLKNNTWNSMKAVKRYKLPVIR